ncbi:MAG: spore coat protein CotJB [Bacillus sp. (in: Bacteria)]|nr:spore coat protein CotJB [Bacillus sp. (in: firmicutes)]MCM1427034.1 spore coat protein CotJB [Eubacterium sp.]
MMNNFSCEREKLLHQIDLMGFVIVEMNLYLDTHPDDVEAVEYLKHYTHMKNQAMREYAAKYEPLTVCMANSSPVKEWIWATLPMPWEGGCN